jgi:hypothetical protein
LPREYEAPTVGTIIPLRSRFSKDPMIEFIGDLNSLLENKGLINSDAIAPLIEHKYTICLRDYLDKTPFRLHEEHWIDGGKQIAAFHPETYLPFFFNPLGSKICRVCDGKHSVRKILKIFKTKTPTVADTVLQTDILKFLLLLEELQLITLQEERT